MAYEQLNLDGFEAPEPIAIDMDQVAASIASAAERRLPDDRLNASERWFQEIGGQNPINPDAVAKYHLAVARQALRGELEAKH